MSELRNLTKNTKLATQVEQAVKFTSRAKGLLGRNTLSRDHALWIDRCNSIHTFFMKFEIDAIFVDRDLKVRAIYSQIKPWRMIWPVFRARSVFELASGVSREQQVEVGDQLYVGH